MAIIINPVIFYMLSAILIASAAMVVFARNPVYSVLFLILAFFNASGLFVLLGAEFLAMVLVIAYVGAVAVLFLFVIMMLDMDVTERQRKNKRYAVMAALLGAVLLVEIVAVVKGWEVSGAAIRNVAARAVLEQPNTHAIGEIIFTKYVLLFELAGLILLVAMIGAVTLALGISKTDQYVRRQSATEQVARRKEDVVKLCNVATGKGIE